MASTKVAALRKTWRGTREHYSEQVKRFLRIFAGTLVPQLLALDFHHVTRSALLALIAPAAEVTWRQLYPALGAAGVDTAPGATIVPEQVDLPVPDLTAPDDTVDVGSIPAELADAGAVDPGSLALGLVAGLIVAWLLLH